MLLSIRGRHPCVVLVFLLLYLFQFDRSGGVSWSILPQTDIDPSL